MSDALNYLLATRPDAMGHYFSFLKEASGTLDPKTRDLISVICKVEAQTEKGFKQYLKRALKDGCTANEVLDALLMAFPTLGLTKIVWAVDILLEMDLPEFQVAAMTGADDWADLGALSDIPEGTGSAIQAGGRTVFVYRSGDEVKAWSDKCPHQGTPMSPDELDGETITCTKHNWVFNLASGDCEGPGNMPLDGLEIKIEDGQVSVKG